MSQDQTPEVRLALLEDFRECSKKNHDEVIKKLDLITRKLEERECTLHAARLLQLNQDMEKYKKKVDDITIIQSTWAGAVGVIVFILTRVFK